MMAWSWCLEKSALQNVLKIKNTLGKELKKKCHLQQAWTFFCCPNHCLVYYWSPNYFIMGRLSKIDMNHARQSPRVNDVNGFPPLAKTSSRHINFKNEQLRPSVKLNIKHKHRLHEIRTPIPCYMVMSSWYGNFFKFRETLKKGPITQTSWNGCRKLSQTIRAKLKFSRA